MIVQDLLAELAELPLMAEVRVAVERPMGGFDKDVLQAVKFEDGEVILELE